MNNPYTTLGIPETATEEEIKKAYRALSRRYHPDANINNPNKAQAEEKFKEIQQAYQQIMDMREKGYTSYSSYNDRYGARSNGSYSTGQSSYGNGGGPNYREFDFGGFEDFFRAFGFGTFTGNNGDYGQGRRTTSGGDERSIHMQAAANYINNRRYQEALNVLSGINNRDGQWYYMAAYAHSGLGNNVQALEYSRMAVNLEPGNSRYRDLYERLSSVGNYYRERQNDYSGTSVVPNNMCLKFCFWNLVCNLCCGGGGMCYGGGC
ncbi:MAG: DnaJ domain-containing protein [Lachnospiraceae bacterium]|nr:DnaJ domain-containing protein [Lachnospiraceae bacterium]